MEEESLEAWQPPDGLEESVSLDSEHTVSISLLFHGLSGKIGSTVSLFQDSGQGLFTSGTSLL